MDAAAELLARNAMDAGLERFVDRDQLDSFLARMEFAGLQKPDLRQTVQELCRGVLSFADLRSAAKNLITILEQQVGARQLQELAPTSVRLQSGRQTRIHYGEGRPPWIASRLQDFFGMHETPRIGRDRTPLVIHLLAPNHRPVQTTTDLAGFWQRLYPQVRRELMRRYPRHSWPETP
jgi:ATP-dependent helicase HrpB